MVVTVTVFNCTKWLSLTVSNCTRWLNRKAKEGKLDIYDSSDSDDDEDDATRNRSEWARAYYEAFEVKNALTFDRWMDMRAARLKEMDENTKRRRQGTYVEKKKKVFDGRNNNMILGCTEPGEKVPDDYDAYMRAYQKWRRRQLKLRHWRMKNGDDADDEKKVTSQALKDMRKSLYLDGFTYNEWLGQIDREERFANRSRDRRRHKSVQFKL